MDEIKELNEGEKEVVMDQKEKEAVSMTEEARTGKFSELEKRLDGMLDEHTERQQYVFRENRITKAVIYVLLAAGGIVSVVYFYFLLLCIGMLVYSDQFYAEAITGAAVMILMIVLNIYLVIRLVKQAKFNQRYEKYFNSLRFKNIESMEDLAVYAGVKKNQVIRDLKRAVKLRLIPQGHFGTEEAILLYLMSVLKSIKKSRACMTAIIIGRSRNAGGWKNARRNWKKFWQREKNMLQKFIPVMI